jgi:hypothetical protein
MSALGVNRIRREGGGDVNAPSPTFSGVVEAGRSEISQVVLPYCTPSDAGAKVR